MAICAPLRTTLLFIRTLIGCAVALVVAFTAAAHADVVYTWVPETLTGLPGGPFNLGQFVFTDAAVAGGSVDFSETCASPCNPLIQPEVQVTGDPSGLISIDDTVPGGGVQYPLTQNSFFASILFDLTFNSDGTLSGVVVENNDSSDLSVSGTGNDWSGTTNSDLLNCNGDGPACQITGYWQAIPEPSSLSLVGWGLIAIAVRARLRRNMA
jgi:hypothetical protein